MLFALVHFKWVSQIIQYDCWNKILPNQKALVPCQISAPWSKWQSCRQILPDPTLMSFMLREKKKKSVRASTYVLSKCLPDVYTSPCKSQVSYVFVHYRFGHSSIYRLKDANQQEAKLSTWHQDSGPEVSRVTCQAKEITFCYRLTKGCSCE